jgi:hypothetical protein
MATELLGRHNFPTDPVGKVNEFEVRDKYRFLREFALAAVAVIASRDPNTFLRPAVSAHVTNDRPLSTPAPGRSRDHLLRNRAAMAASTRR